jgi:putative Holliday junction resolvase
LGVDWGMKRIGIAVGEREFGIATARPHLLATGSLKKDAEAIATLAKQEMAQAIVVGLPEQEEDESPIANIGLKLAEQLREGGWTVYTVNEALTSIEAEENLKQEGVRAAKRKDKRDGMAATIILERFFNEQNPA